MTITVKALEWSHFDNGNAYAGSIITTYFAHTDGTWCHRNGNFIQAGHNLEDAKAGAQVDYETRILSALISSPGKDGGQEVEAVAARDVMAERERQKSVEGWTVDQDDTHTDNELSKAAACYAINNAALWPWSMNWWKPTDRRRDLVKSGALVLAEIERLDRAALKAAKEVSP